MFVRRSESSVENIFPFLFTISKVVMFYLAYMLYVGVSVVFLSVQVDYGNLPPGSRAVVALFLMLQSKGSDVAGFMTPLEMLTFMSVIAGCLLLEKHFVRKFVY